MNVLLCKDRPKFRAQCILVDGLRQQSGLPRIFMSLRAMSLPTATDPSAQNAYSCRHRCPGYFADLPLNKAASRPARVSCSSLYAELDFATECLDKVPVALPWHVKLESFLPADARLGRGCASSSWLHALKSIDCTESLSRSKPLSIP